jgi:hypothetical protein
LFFQLVHWGKPIAGKVTRLCLAKSAQRKRSLAGSSPF